MIGGSAMASHIRLSAIVLIGGAITWGGWVTSVMASPDGFVASGTVVSDTAIAQNTNPSQGYAVLHVNPQSGSNHQGDGSQLRPYQTITHALKQASENTLILLASGVYSADSGETFPIVLKPRVTVQGMAGPDVADVMIRGNGGYFSESSGVRNITLLGANNAGLANVTVSNPHPEGIGLWIESGSPVILDSAFFRNGLSGIHIAGGGTPVIRGNYFLENGQAGLVIAGPSSAAVESNVFENTGTGITVAPEATPKIENNRISSNLDGLVIHADARPTLRNNQIAHNRRNSIVDYASWSTVPTGMASGASQPPPPTVSETVAPVASESITPAAPEAAAIASPPEIAPLPSPPTRNLAATTPAEESAPVEEPAAIAAAPENLATAPEAFDLDVNVPTVEATETATADLNSTAEEPLVPAAIALAALGNHLSADLNDTSTAVSAVEIPTPPPVAAQAALTRFDLTPVMTASETVARSLPEEDPVSDLEASAHASELTTDFAALPAVGASRDRSDALSAEASSPESVPIPVIPPPAETVDKPDEEASFNTLSANDLASVIEATGDLPALPAAATGSPATGAAPLRVPGAEIPMGSGGDLPELFTTGAGAALPSLGPPPPPSLANSLGLKYRVLVAAADAEMQDQIRRHVADAFRTRAQGQMYMQVGAYPTLTEAEAQVERLDQVGFQAEIQEIP